MTSQDRFAGVAQDYAAYRPSYPQEMVEEIAAAAAGVAGASLALDAGCGTGIFTRQLASALPQHFKVVGVDPSDDMRSRAVAATGDRRISYVDGKETRLHGESATAALVTAASSAHWFDRERFYREAARILAPGGVLAIIDYIRDVAASPAARAIEDFLREHGGPKAYVRPDYLAEFRFLSAFQSPRAQSLSREYSLELHEAVGLGLSSSHARPIVEALGHEGAAERLAAVLRPLADHAGLIPYRYEFRLAAARRI